jgi:hypothetical protein
VLSKVQLPNYVVLGSLAERRLSSSARVLLIFLAISAYSCRLKYKLRWEAVGWSEKEV